MRATNPGGVSWRETVMLDTRAVCYQYWSHFAPPRGRQACGDIHTKTG